MKKLLAVTVLVLALAGCGGSDQAEADPYATYLATNPDPSLLLSPEDAQLRAALGCGEQWAAGTIDAALQDAYGC